MHNKIIIIAVIAFFIIISFFSINCGNVYAQWGPCQNFPAGWCSIDDGCEEMCSGTNPVYFPQCYASCEFCCEYIAGIDGDFDGVLDENDNCPEIPNGPRRGTCTAGTNIGAVCGANSQCGAGGFCSMAQEDTDGDGTGDACEMVTTTSAQVTTTTTIQLSSTTTIQLSSTTTIQPVSTTTIQPATTTTTTPANSEWTPVNAPTQYSFWAVWGMSVADIYITGSDMQTLGGVLLHYNGSGWIDLDWQYGPTTGIWGTASDNLYVNDFFDGVYHYNGTNWNLEYEASMGFLDIWGFSPANIYTVGMLSWEGRILHYDGSQWSLTGTGSSDQLHAIWGKEPDNIFIVSQSGKIYHFDGTAWSTMASGVTNDLFDVWGTSSSDVFAVGTSGTILHYNGTAWSPMVSGTSKSLNSIWGTLSSNIFAVGDSGTILRYNGTSWSPMVSGTSKRLQSVLGSSGSDVYAVGDGGTILHYDGTVITTTTTTPPTVIELSDFTATPKAGKVILQWSTESETDNAGFNLYRSESGNGVYVKINAALIPAKGSSTQGASYEFIDTNVQNRKTYYYKLEDIDLSGTATMHGPVSATPRLIYGVGK